MDHYSGSKDEQDLTYHEESDANLSEGSASDISAGQEHSIEASVSLSLQEKQKPLGYMTPKHQ